VSVRHRFIGALAAIAALAGGDARAIDCAVFTTGVAFGVYDPTVATPTDSTGRVRLRCMHTGGGAARANYTIALSAGNGGGYAQRQLRAGPGVLDYNLFNLEARTRVWGDGTQGSALVSGSLLVNRGAFSVVEAEHPIYGRIRAQQPADPGSYSDTILVTLTF
jgi:spore coat protein U-like protein